MCFRADRKNKMTALASDWLRHFRLLWNHWIEFNETWQGSKISTSSTKFVFFWPIEKKTKMTALASNWLKHFLLLLWNCGTEFNETWQESRSQRPLLKVCVFRLIGKIRWRLAFWLAETFSHSSLKPLNGIQRNLTGIKNSTSSTKLVFFSGRSEKQDGPPVLLLTETFSTSL